MSRRAALVLALSCACLVAVSGQATTASDTPARQDGLVTKTIPLTPFTNITLCAPLNVLVQPGAAAQYGVVVTGEAAVVKEIGANVTRGVLHLTLQGPINTTEVVEIIIMLPPTALLYVGHFATGAHVVVSPGFSSPTFSVVSAFGAGELSILGFSASAVDLDLSGLGDVILDGSFENVSAVSSGSGALYIQGVNGTVDLALSGLADVFIIPAAPTVAITGSATGINTVQYSAGTCTVSSQFSFLSACQAVSTLAPPVTTTTWTCGIQTNGTFVCRTGGGAYVASSSGETSVSGGVGSLPVVGVGAVDGGEALPSSYSFTVPSEEGEASQSGSVGAGGTVANSAVTGTGSVSAVSNAGPAGATTSTTNNGVTTTGGTGLVASTVAPSPPLTFSQILAGAAGSPSPDAFNFAAPGQAQSGSTGPTGSVANSAVTGTGSVSAVSNAGPGSATTSTTRNGQTTTMGTGAGSPLVAQPPTPAPWPAPESEEEVFVARVGGGSAGAATSLTCTAADVAMPLPGVV